MASSPKSPINKAIFPVAGLGTRFLPATKAQPKEMLPVVDKPLLQYAVEEAYEAGVREMSFVSGRMPPEKPVSHSPVISSRMRVRSARIASRPVIAAAPVVTMIVRSSFLA